MFFERILVAEAPYRAPGARRAERVACRVGVLPWSAARSWLSLIVRCSFRFRAAPGPVALEPIAPAPLRVPRDFVPARPKVDVTLSGHVELAALPSGAAPSRFGAFGLDDRLVAFVVEGAGRVPLAPPHTHDDLGAPVLLGPRDAHDGAEHGFRHGEDFDLAVYQAAPERLRYDDPRAEHLRLIGLLPDVDETELTLACPWPRAIVEYTAAGIEPDELTLPLDAIAVDLDARAVDVTWRGRVETTARPAEDVERVILGWAERARWESDGAGAWREALRELPRGAFGWATERDDALADREPPPLTDEELAMARYESWDCPEGPEPELEPEQAARIAAELCEREPRADVLARHGLDGYRWSVEERAWAQKLAGVEEPAAEGRAYAEAFARAAAALARPEEADVKLEDYARLTARLGRGDPAEPLAAAGLGLGGFMRVDRMWRERAEADASVAAAIERLVAEEEARLDAEEAARADEEP